MHPSYKPSIKIEEKIKSLREENELKLEKNTGEKISFGRSYEVSYEIELGVGS